MTHTIQWHPLQVGPGSPTIPPLYYTALLCPAAPASILTANGWLPSWASTTLGPHAHSIRPYGPCRGHVPMVTPRPAHGHDSDAPQAASIRPLGHVHMVQTGPPGARLRLGQQSRRQNRRQNRPRATLLTRTHPTCTASPRPAGPPGSGPAQARLRPGSGPAQAPRIPITAHFRPGARRRRAPAIRHRAR